MLATVDTREHMSRGGELWLVARAMQKAVRQFLGDQSNSGRLNSLLLSGTTVVIQVSVCEWCLCVRACVPVCVHTYGYAWEYMCICAVFYFLQVCIHVFCCIHVCVCIYLYVYICAVCVIMCLCMCRCTYVYECMHMCRNQAQRQAFFPSGTVHIFENCNNLSLAWSFLSSLS